MRSSGEFPEEMYTDYIALVSDSAINKPQDEIVIQLFTYLF
jgi:hypothetical protein